MLIQWVSNQSESAKTILDNRFQDVLDFLWHTIKFLHQNLEELNNFWIVVVNTEVQTIEEGHWILIDVGIVFTDD